MNWRWQCKYPQTDLLPFLVGFFTKRQSLLLYRDLVSDLCGLQNSIEPTVGKTPDKEKSPGLHCGRQPSEEQAWDRAMQACASTISNRL